MGISILIIIYIALGMVYINEGKATHTLFDNYSDKIKYINNYWYKEITYLDLILLIIFIPFTIICFITAFIIYIGRILYKILNKNIYD